MTKPIDVLILGTDEAGYGPNLGPLVVGASCWRAAVPVAPSHGDAPSLLDFASVENDVEEDDAPLANAANRLNAILAPISGSKKSVFPLLDSKKLYGASRSLAALERSFLLASATLDRQADSFETIARELRSDLPESAPPWERDVALKTPVDPATLQTPLAGALQTVRERLAEENAELLDLAARRIQPEEFNASVDRLRLKSEVVAEATTALVVESLGAALARLGALGFETPRFALILCDKLGGRNHYETLLRARFDVERFVALRERRDASVYRFTASAGRDRLGATTRFGRPIRFEIRFTAKGEANAPTALASIVAKYLRELSMSLFNDFWRRALEPEKLRPTAGYPVDALRFRADVENIRQKLRIPDDVFWRKK